MKKSKEQKREDKILKLHNQHGNVMNLFKVFPLSMSEIQVLLDYEHAQTLTIAELFDYI